MSAVGPTVAPLLTPAEVTRLLNVSLRTVRRLIASGDLPVVRIGRSIRIRPEDCGDDDQK